MAIEGHKDPEVVLIGTIKFKDNIGKCKVEIYANDDNEIPHMHISNRDKTFETCVSIHSNEYITHNGKYNSEFTSKQCKTLNEWMGSTNPKTFGKLTNWEISGGLWNILNPDCKNRINLKEESQPCYENMIISKNV